MIQKTLVLIKPDGLIKSLTGNIISVLSETKLKIVGAKVTKVSRTLAKEHYSGLKPSLIKKHGQEKGEEIFENILDYIQGNFHTNRVLALVYQGKNSIRKIRKIAGKTNPEKASPTSIQGKYGRINNQTQVMENVLHCSDNIKNSIKEINLWFNDKEIVE